MILVFYFIEIKRHFVWYIFSHITIRETKIKCNRYNSHEESNKYSYNVKRVIYKYNVSNYYYE